MITYVNTFNKIKLACVYRQAVLYVTINRKNTELCNLLLKQNILAGFRILQIDDYKIYELIVNENAKFFDLRNFIRVKKLRKISFKKAFTLNNRYSHSCYIFMTSVGMLTLSELIKFKLGGFLMFRLK